MARKTQQIETEGYEYVKKGNKKVFDSIFRKYYNNMANYAYVFVKSRSIADEIVSDVFADLWIKRQSIDIKNSLSAYLYKSVKNRALSYLRKKKIDFYSFDEIKETYTENCNPESKIIKLEQKQKLDNALEKIPPRSREVFVLHRFDGLKYQEIADLLGISKNTVENHIVKAMKILRKHYEK